MKKPLAGILLFAMMCIQAAGAQVTGGQPTRETEGPPINPWSQQFKYTGSSLSAICLAPQTVGESTWTTAGASLTSIVVATNVGTITFAANDGLYAGARISISSGVAGLLGTYTLATVPTGATATIATSGVADGTYTTGITLKTTFPRDTLGIWSIKRLRYDGSSNLITSYWAQSQENPPSNQTQSNLVCTNWATY